MYVHVGVSECLDYTMYIEEEVYAQFTVSRPQAGATVNRGIERCRDV